MGLSTKVYGAITAKLTDTSDLGTLEHTLNMSSLFTSMASGTGSGQADLVFDDRRTISADSDEDLDLAGGLESPFGETLTFAKVKAVIIKASEDNTDLLVIGGANNPFDGWFGDTDQTVAIPPGGMFQIAAPADGWTVTAGTGDELRVTNAAAGDPATYDIVIIGTSA